MGIAGAHYRIKVMTNFRAIPALALISLAASTTPLVAHPHVFAEARLEVVSTGGGSIERLQHVWRFDDLFTTTVILEFDADANGELDDAETDKLTAVITDSISDFNYFLTLTSAGKDFTFKPVDDMRALFEDGQMILFFTAVPDGDVQLADKPSISVYDPTFYTSIEFYDDDAMALKDAPSGCGFEMVVPDVDTALEQNQSTLTEDFFNDPANNDYSKIFATRMEISCAS